MKKFLLILIVFPMAIISFSQDPFISEIHYDNNGGDVNEGVEVTIPANYSCSGNLEVIPYNGNGGTSYSTAVVSYTTSASEQYISVPISGLQNGAPDGLALACNGTLIEFLSYEGSFTATNGPASGVTSTDVGVVEGSSTTANQSLQLTDAGWQEPADANFGSLNPNTTPGGSASSCGISSFGPASAACSTNTAGTDGVTVSVPYSGIEDDATVSITVNGASASNTGDNPATTANGTISFTAQEGDSYVISITDADAECSLNDVSGTIDANFCPEIVAGDFVISSQFVNPCGNDGSNEFIIGETSDNPVNIADLAFASAAPGDIGSEYDDFNFFWRGSNVAANAYDITGLSNETAETCGNSNECYAFSYPSDAADNTRINTLIAELNAVSGCTVFLPVPSSNLIPANSKVAVFLGAYNCGFNDVATKLDFTNHCDGGTQYYVVFGKGDGGGSSNAPCTNPSSGYFSNSASRTTYSLVYIGGDNNISTSYSVDTQLYNPESVSSGSAGVATPGSSGLATWTGNEGCVPAATSLILPIQLASISAEWLDNEKVASLEWETLSETDNDYFEVEHSVDGLNWSFAGKVEGSGTTDIAHNYSFTHTKAVNGVNYYRVKQVDFNGHFSFSEILSVNALGMEKLQLVSVNRQALNLITSVEGNASYQVFNSMGSLVSTADYEAVKGSQAIYFNQELAHGFYVIQVTIEGERMTKKFLIH